MEIILASATMCDKEGGGSWGKCVEGFFYQEDIKENKHLKLTESIEIPKDCYWSWSFKRASELQNKN